MAINGYFFNALFDEQTQTYDREYSAGMMSDYLKGIIGNGVISNPSTSLQVLSDSNLDITVGVGKAWIEGKKLENTAVLNMTLDAADPLLNRIDRIVAVADFTNRLCNIEILKGTSAATPTAPELTRNDSRYELCLAEIYIGKGVTAITQANITDTRANTTICGWATSLISQVDTATLFVQWQTAYANYYAETKSELDAFMETLTQELGVITYIKEYKYFGVEDPDVNPLEEDGCIIPLENYTYEATDIIDVYINGLKALPNSPEDEDHDYTLTIVDGQINIKIFNNGTTPEDWETNENSLEVRVLKSVIGIEQSVNN